MYSRLLALFVAFCCFGVSLLGAQQAPSSQTIQRDPQALQVLAQALASAGGAALLTTIQDYTGSGTVNYYWGDGEQGTVIVKGRGTAQYRTDAVLAEGTRTFAISNGLGFVNETDGRSWQISEHNTLHLGSLTLPWVYLNSVLSDPTMSVIYIGLESKGSRQLFHIRTQRVFQNESDPGLIVSKLTARDFFIDAQTLLIASTLDMLHPEHESNVDYPHEVQFSDYRTVNGIVSPFSIVETVGGNTTFSIQLNEVKFNVGLNDADFESQ